MATQLTPTSAIAATPQAAAADATGNYVVPGANPTGFIIRVNNGGASPVTVIVDDVTTAIPEGATAAATALDLSVIVPNAAVRYIVIPRAKLARFINPTNGRVNWTYSATPTSVTLDVIGIV